MKDKILKGLAIVVAALLAGAIAGLSMFAVAKLTGVLDAYKNAAVELKNTATTPAAGKPAGASSGSESAAAPAHKAEKAITDRAVVTSANDVSGIAEDMMPAVVAITGTTEYEAFSFWGPSQTYEAQSSGSGFIMDEDDDEYMIVTNNHVVADTKELVITFVDETTANAEVKGRDADKDVAVISVKKAELEKGTADNIKIAVMGDSDKIRVGQGVVAIGNALGYGQSVTAGIISALNREITAEGRTIKNLIQTDAAINPGNSGGALLNMNGEVIGINAAKYSSTEVEGVGYAIPISSVKDLLESFAAYEIREKVAEDEQGYLGIQGQDIDAQMSQMYDMPEGVYVYKIVENVPAATSGLQEKDIITKVDGQSVSGMEELRDLLNRYRGGETVKLTVFRLEGSEYKEMTVEVTLANKKDVVTE